ncbi:PIN domain-containing protein [Hymenobacter sp. HD11105]
MVYLILDTNIWIGFIAKDIPTGIFQQLQDKINDKEVILLSNDIIIEEWNRNKEQTIKAVTNTIKGNYNAAKKVADFLDPQDKSDYLKSLQPYFNNDQNIIDIATKRVEETERILRDSAKAPITDAMKLNVVEWALNKRAPFKNKANSVGDALILLSSVEYIKARTIGITDSIFVSFNHDDYTDGKDINKLHDEFNELITDSHMTFTRNIGEALDLAPTLIGQISDYIDFHADSWVAWQAEISRGK